MNKSGNERRRNGLQIDAKLVDRHVAVEIGFMHATKGTEEMTQTAPHAFLTVGMAFAPTVTIVVPRPLLEAMTDGDVLTLERIIAIILVGVDQRFDLSKV